MTYRADGVEMQQPLVISWWVWLPLPYTEVHCGKYVKLQRAGWRQRIDRRTLGIRDEEIPPKMSEMWWTEERKSCPVALGK